MIGNQREWQGIFLLELFLRLRLVFTHAEHLQSLFLQRFPVVAQTASLLGASRRVGFWIEINQRRPLRVNILEIDRFAVLIRRGDLRRGCADGQRLSAGEGGETKEGEDAHGKTT